MVATVISDVVDSGMLRAVGYLLAGTLAVVRYWWERRVPPPRPIASWPPYWLVSALLLYFVGVSRATDLTGAIADLGRAQARSDGWYDARRTAQAVAVLIVATVWAVGVVVAIWRVPPRRRRYLPSVISISTLMAFGAVRLVSLHHIDTILYHRELGDVRYVAFIELALLAATSATIVLAPRLRAPEPPVTSAAPT